jgi:hypothetical protein
VVEQLAIKLTAAAPDGPEVFARSRRGRFRGRTVRRVEGLFVAHGGIEIVCPA